MAAAEEPGKVAILMVGASGQTVNAWSGHTRGISTGSKTWSDRRTLTPLPFNGSVGVAGGGKLSFMFTTEGIDIIESEESDFTVDVTYKNMNTGAMTNHTLTLEQMTGFTPSGTVDKTFVAVGEQQEICYHTIPNGIICYLGWHTGGGKIHGYIGDDT